MLTILPDFVMELEERLDQVIRDTAAKNHIDLFAVQDSRAIKQGKDLIVNSMARLYEKYDVATRISLENFEEEIKMSDKTRRPSKKNSMKENKKYPYKKGRKKNG